MRNLIDFCHVKDNSLDEEVCDYLIKFFHKNENLHQRYDEDKRPNFTQFNFTANRHLNPVLHKKVVDSALSAIAEYKEKVPEAEFWQQNYGYEEFRLKYYRKNTEDQFDTHVDAIDMDSSLRFLAFFWYLNDVDEGGETQFTNFDLTIKPKKGRLFMFPPLWLYPHKGNISISHDKYLLSSYLHFT